MRRDVDKAADYANRHGVPRHYGQAEALIEDAGVDAVYVATPPSSHLDLALKVAQAGKPCLVEKPMAMSHSECRTDGRRPSGDTGRPLFVAYYRRALPRFLRVRELLREGAIGELSSVHITHYDPLARGEAANGWRFRPDDIGRGVVHGSGISRPGSAGFSRESHQNGSGDARRTREARIRPRTRSRPGFEFESGNCGNGHLEFQRGFFRRSNDVYRFRR